MVPAAQGLISGSISESGGVYAQNLTGAIEYTKRMAKAAGCDGIFEPIKKCMQKKPAGDVVSAANDAVGDHWVSRSLTVSARPFVLTHAMIHSPGPHC